MEGFKKSPKIACFKEGGQVGYKSRKEHSESQEMAEDIKQDKKIVKKAIGMHDEQQHEAKTDLSGLKKGGRAKKEKGTVKKYKAGGSISMKKDAEDIKEISEVKKTKVEKLCGGGKTKKMAVGGDVEAAKEPQGSGYDSDPFVKLRKKVFGS